MQSDHTCIGTIDILIAIVATGDDIGARMLRSHGIYSSEIRSEIARTSTVGSEVATPPAKTIVENAIKVARELNHTEVDSVHLLLGLLSDRTSLASSVLAALGLNLDQLRSEILRSLNPRSTSEIARRKSLEARFRDHPGVQALRQRIEQLQIKLEESVVAMEFVRAASYRDERLAAQQTLEELYTELGRDEE